MKTLVLALGLVALSAVSTMAAPQDSPYLCNVASTNQVCR
jgi:hypothetical protein